MSKEFFFQVLKAQNPKKTYSKMDGIFINWILLTGVYCIGLASPGPDFVITVRNSISYSRKAGVLTAIGFAAGVAVHVTYTLFGLAALIAQSVLFFNIIKYAGAAYLLYMGVQSLRSQGFNTQDTNIDKKHQNMISPMQCLWSGFLTNLLNPKVTLFFLAIFSQFITPQTPIAVQVFYGITCVLMTGLWFSIVAVFLTNSKIKALFLKFTKWIDKTCGVLLIALSIKLAFSKAP